MLWLPRRQEQCRHRNSPIFSDDGQLDFKKLVGDFERDIIVEALTLKSGNAAAAARRLSVSRRILNYKIEKLGLAAKSFKVSKAHAAK